MDQKILNYLKNNRVCVLATQLIDGSPHAAAMHYSHQENPLVLYFSTKNTSRKLQALKNSNSVKGSLTVGISEQEWITLQMDGLVRVVSDPAELTAAKAIHYPKHPSSQKFEHDPATVFLAFIPAWYRYTDYNSDPPFKIESSA